MSLLGTIGNVAKNAIGAAAFPYIPGASYIAQHVDPTPGFSATNVIRTQSGNVLGAASRAAGAILAPQTTNQGQPTKDYNTTDSTNPNPSPKPYGGDTGSGTSAQDAQDRANALFGIDNGLSSANDALGRLDNQANTGYGNIDRQYQDAYNRLHATEQLGTAQYNQNKNNQLNEYLSNRNQVATNTRNYLDAARRTLGANGAGGGSAARYNVPLEAQTQAAQGNAGAQATNNKNIIALDQSHQKNEDAFGNNVNDIQNQRIQGRNDYQSQIESQRANLLNTIAQLTGQRTIANGGDYKAALAASNPYTSQIPGIMSKIDSLAATPAVREQQYTLDAPSLAGYNWARPAAAPQAVQDPSLAGPNYVPQYGQDNQDQQQNPVFSLFGLDPNQQQFA